MKATLLGPLGGLLALLCGIPSARAQSESPAKHVVLMVWDGMRPDFMSKTQTPTLWQLAQRGVTFRRHHSVYPTLTSVNAAALATGVVPGRSGPIGNYEYRPQLERGKNARMDAAETIRAADQASGGKFLAVPTIAELVQSKGGRTAIAGTKSAPLLFDRKARSTTRSITIFEGTVLPETAQAGIEKSLGVFPETKDLPSTAQDQWTTRALTEMLWHDGVPEFSVLWLGDPDRSEHATAPGSPTALAAIQSADANLAAVLQALQEKGALATTDLFIASDHGFSTIARPLDLAGRLAEDGFPVVRPNEPAPPEGGIRVVGNGGTVLFYLTEPKAGTATRLVEWLQRSDFAGVIFAREKLAGTFPLARVQLEKEGGPDVALAFQWTDRRNQYGVPGTIEANGNGEAKGTHGTLSPYDVHNLLVAAGPHFRAGQASELPSSNLDVAATIMHLLSLDPAQSLDGRVLTEALRDGAKPPAATTKTEEVTAGSWRQHLRISTVGATTYLDEGNGGPSR